MSIEAGGPRPAMAFEASMRLARARRVALHQAVAEQHRRRAAEAAATLAEILCGDPARASDGGVRR